MAATSKSDISDDASGAATRRTVSNAETDTKRMNQDIGADEANQVAMMDQTRSWNANTKQAYDTLVEELHAGVKGNQNHSGNLQTIQIQMLTNMAVNADNLQKQHLAHRDIATDRTWNVDEVSALVAKSGVEADAAVALVLKAVADAVGAAKK